MRIGVSRPKNFERASSTSYRRKSVKERRKSRIRNSANQIPLQLIRDDPWNVIANMRNMFPIHRNIIFLPKRTSLKPPSNLKYLPITLYSILKRVSAHHFILSILRITLLKLRRTLFILQTTVPDLQDMFFILHSTRLERHDG